LSGCIGLYYTVSLLGFIWVPFVGVTDSGCILHVYPVPSRTTSWLAEWVVYSYLSIWVTKSFCLSKPRAVEVSSRVHTDKLKYLATRCRRSYRARIVPPQGCACVNVARESAAPTDSASGAPRPTPLLRSCPTQPFLCKQPSTAHHTSPLRPRTRKHSISAHTRHTVPIFISPNSSREISKNRVLCR